MILAAGVGLKLLLKYHMHKNTLAEEIGFIVLSLPLIAFWFLEQFRDEEKPEKVKRAAIVENHKGGTASRASYWRWPRRRLL